MANADATAPQVDDPFFRLSGDSEWNALIGQQGNEENYVDGYIQAAIELASAVIDKKMHAERDTLVMPILYNARHGLELSLKFAISRLNEMGVANFHPKNHDIMSHWKLLDGSALGDEALRQCVEALKPYVTSLSRIDDDGQELRYSENREGQKSLSDRSLANIAVIRKSLDDLSEAMSRMKYRVHALADERQTGTFTSVCSRSDLLAIAQMLPPANDWRTPAFDEAKAKVMNRFGLTSNKKFSNAVDHIKGNREMGVIIGLERTLAHLSDQNAVFVIEQWSKRHPVQTVRDDLGTDFGAERNWDAMRAHGRIANEVNEAVCKTLTPDEIADLDTIFYIGRDRVFCEHYESCLESTKKEHRRNGRLAVDVNHLMEKTNLLICLVAGIAKLGRPGLSRQLMAMRPDQAQT